MKLATWNVNSLTMRLPRLIDWLAANQPDIIGLQETKLEDVRFPAMEIAATGYEAIFYGQRTYNGVAILSKVRATDACPDMPEFPDDHKRVLAATIGEGSGWKASGCGRRPRRSDRPGHPRRR